MVVPVIVQGFAVLGEDGGEGNHASVLRGDAVQRSGDQLFFDTRPAHLHGRSVHQVAHVCGFIQFFDFTGFFGSAQRDDRFDQFDGCVVLNGGGANARQCFQPEVMVEPIRRKEVDLSPFGHGLADHFVELFQRIAAGNAYLGS